MSRFLPNSKPCSKMLFTRAQMRRLDQLAISHYGVSAYQLMCRAGEAIFSRLLTTTPSIERVVCFCGGGNNGGDGWVVARLCHNEGIETTVFSSVDPETLTGAAREAFDGYLSAGGHWTPFDPEKIEQADCLIDALFGTGLDRAISGESKRWIEMINASGKRVISADIPSGIDVDTGSVWGVGVRATETVTFIADKRGIHTGAAVDYTGALFVDSLGVDVAQLLQLEPSLSDPMVSCLEISELATLLPRRARSMHKGEAGRVLVVGGASGYIGAAILAGKAALRAGAGLVTVATDPCSVSAITAHSPELMVHPVQQALALDPLIASTDLLLIGMGLGQSEWAEALLTTAIISEKPLILDADALNLLAVDQKLREQLLARQKSTLLTPHPGEAARLLNCTIAEVEKDRFSAAQQLSEKYGAIVVLKGAGTIVVDASHRKWLCQQGNPGMATAGMGDLLAGVISALFAQGLKMDDAARVGVLVHALAGDAAAEKAPRGLIATDLLPFIRVKVNPCR